MPRGGFRVGSGRPRKPLEEKILDVDELFQDINILSQIKTIKINGLGAVNISNKILLVSAAQNHV